MFSDFNFAMPSQFTLEGIQKKIVVGKIRDSKPSKECLAMMVLRMHPNCKRVFFPFLLNKKWKIRNQQCGSCYNLLELSTFVQSTFKLYIILSGIGADMVECKLLVWEKRWKLEVNLSSHFETPNFFSGVWPSLLSNFYLKKHGDVKFRMRTTNRGVFCPFRGRGAEIAALRLDRTGFRRQKLCS